MFTTSSFGMLGKLLVGGGLIILLHAALSMLQFKSLVRDVYGPDEPYWVPLDVWVESVVGVILALAGAVLEGGSLRPAVHSADRPLPTYDDVTARVDLTPITPLEAAIAQLQQEAAGDRVAADSKKTR